MVDAEEVPVEVKAPLATERKGFGPRPFTRIDYLMISAITLLGGVLRFVTLGLPKGHVFDEVYYAKDACLYVKGAAKVCGIESEQTMVHPPLGKWILSLGVKVFGYDEFGWRVMAAAAGTITIVLLYLLARRLLKSTLGASVAAALLAIDLLHLVQSRISMLDVFVPMFVVAALLVLVAERDSMLAGGERSAWRRGGAGVLLGAAVASKWTGGFFIPLAIVLVVAWAIGRQEQRGEKVNVRSAIREELPRAIPYLVLIPLAVYVFSYVGRVDGSFLALPWSHGSFLRAVWDQQFTMWDFHAHLEAMHGYQSPAWTWPLGKRPMSYYFNSDGGEYREIMAFGSPLVWWSALLALVYAAYRWFRSHEVISSEGVILGGFLFAYVPWLLQQTDRGATFVFYLLPAVPFMCLALAYLAVRISRSLEGKLAITTFGAIAIASFIFFVPLALSIPLTQQQWQQRILFEDCDNKEGNEGSPPGWCWI